MYNENTMRNHTDWNYIKKNIVQNLWEFYQDSEKKCKYFALFKKNTAVNSW